MPVSVMPGATPDDRLPFLVGAALKITPSMGTKQATADNNWSVEYTLPPNGYLQEIEIDITAEIDALTAPAGDVAIWGQAAIIKNISLVAGGTITIFSMDGVSYYYQEAQLNGTFNLDPLTTAYAPAAAAASVTLPIILRPTINRRDLQGLLPVASHETDVVLRIEFADPSTIGTGLTWTVTPTVTPYPTWFTRPDPRQYKQPPLDSIVSTVMTREVPSGVDWRYEWPRNAVYLQMSHLYGDPSGTPPDDYIDVAQMVTDKVNIQQYLTPRLADIRHTALRNRARRAGLIAFDLLGNTGDGDQGSASGVVSSKRFNVAETVFTLNTTSKIMRHLRKQLVPINGRGGW